MSISRVEYKLGFRITARLMAVALIAAAMPIVFADPAEARIKCKGIFQVTKNALRATPYCKDKEIARVARSYGWKVTDADVSNKPLTKVRICQSLGGDVRLQGACGAYSSKNFF